MNITELPNAQVAFGYYLLQARESVQRWNGYCSEKYTACGMRCGYRVAYRSVGNTGVPRNAARAEYFRGAGQLRYNPKSRASTI